MQHIIQSINHFIENHRRLALWLFLLVSALSAFAIPLVRFHNLFLTRDWSLFYSISYFVKSCWLHYHVLPIHNPYVLGGMDMLANPQSKVFSPLSIFDLLFTAPYANLLSLVALSIIGGYGMYKLLRHLKISEVTTLLITFIYMHASWFSLHFSEGHIIFGSFQLMGWVLFFTLNIYEARFKIYLAALLAFMILDGGMYAFIYSSLLIFFSLLFRLQGLSLISFFKSLFQQWKTTMLALTIFIGLAMAKIVPLLALHADRDPIRENILLDTKSLLAAFFYPFQYILLEIPGASFHAYKQGFHELGAYIGVVAFAMLLIYLVRQFRKNIIPYLALLVFFFWIGSGIGHYFNPWSLFQQIPVVNNAHIQPRALFIPWLMMIILLAFTFEYLKAVSSKYFIYVLGLFLTVEALFVSNYPYAKIYTHERSTTYTAVFDKVMQHTNVDKTIDNPGSWGRHHELFEQVNTASKNFMDPAVHRGEIKTVSDPDYRGEIYFLSGNGEVIMESYTPGKLVVQLKTLENAEVQVNTNYLLRWTADDSSVSVFEKDGLLTFQTREFDGRIIFKYSPEYLWFIIQAYLLSLILLGAYVFRWGRQYPPSSNL